MNPELKRIARYLVLILLMFAALDGMTQTVVKNVPIVSPDNDPYTIEVWAFFEETKKYGWIDIADERINFEQQLGWYHNREVNIDVPGAHEYHIRITRGSKSLECVVITYIDIYGGDFKEKIKDKPDLRKIVKLDGSTYVFGTPIPKPS